MSSTTWSSFGKYLVRLTRLFCKWPSVELPHSSSRSAFLSLFYRMAMITTTILCCNRDLDVNVACSHTHHAGYISATHLHDTHMAFKVLQCETCHYCRSLCLLLSSSLLKLSYHCCYCTPVSCTNIISFDVFVQGVHVLDLVADVLSVSVS